MNPPQAQKPHVDAHDIAALVARAEMLMATSSRRLLGIAGPPGSGKSTLAEALLEALGDRAIVVGMDGFHLDNSVLEELGRRQRKGAPDTFDVDGYVNLLERLSHPSASVIYAPRFDRAIETAIAAAIPVAADVPLVITEGNYLLLQQGGWERVRPWLDEVWYIDVPATERERRLVARRRTSGEALADAATWVRDVDMTNAAIVEASQSQADVIVSFSPAP